MLFVDESSMNFLYLIFPEGLQRGDLPHGVVKMPLGSSTYCPCPGTEPKFRPGRFLLAPLIPDSEATVQVGISMGCRASSGTERCCPYLLPLSPNFEECLSGLGLSVSIRFMHFQCLPCLEYEKLFRSSN